MITTWDSEERTAIYHMRSDYSPEAIADLLEAISIEGGGPVADLDAGNGKLTMPLLKHGMTVFSIEEDENLRAEGIEITRNQNVTWLAGSHKNSRLKNSSVQASFLGSSISFSDPEKTLLEVSRITRPGGWLVCIWNRRDMTNSLHSRVKKMIQCQVHDSHDSILSWDPTEVIEASGLFEKVCHTEGDFQTLMKANEWVDAWRRDECLINLTKSDQEAVLEQIARLVRHKEALLVPFTTLVWYSRLKRSGKNYS